MDDPRIKPLRDFLAWCSAHITGDEKGEAQLFLDRLFQAFGHKGIKEAGANLEVRIKKEDQRGTAFADLVWKPIVLIEMKKRKEDLTRHYRQAFDYWTRLVPSRPRYVVLCNFDEFWVYDFETQMDVPVDKVKLVDLPEKFEPIQFLFPQHPAPVFGNHHEKVTRDAADLLATCFNKLMVRHVNREEAQRFILQLLVALFSEDIKLLPKNLVLSLLKECKKPADTFDLMGGLFEAMNTPGVTPGGRYKGVDYFNGGLFAKPARIELLPDEVAPLVTAAEYDWSMVRPEIFGTIFEHSLGKTERHAYGAHFTHPTDIMKIVGPTIVEPWRALIDGARNLSELEKLRERMQRYTVLDPACGSGNFLYIAYRELKRLEARLFERIAEQSKRDKGQRQIGFVTARQFFGIDINPFAVEIAKVTMMIARKLAIDELHIDERPLPLDNLDKNFIAGDALVEPVRSGGKIVRHTLFAEEDEEAFASGQVIPTKWPKTDVIIGNPPFLGAKLLKPERGDDYVKAVRKTYPQVPGMADYCVYWLRKAHDQLPECTPSDPIAGRAGLVGTQNIRNNKSRVGGLDYIVKSGTIIEAVDNQPWSGEANVHVSIANWVKHVPGGARNSANAKHWRKSVAEMEAPVDESGTLRGPESASAPASALLISKLKRLWHKTEARLPVEAVTSGEAPPTADSLHLRRKDKSFELSFTEGERISSALSIDVDVSSAQVLQCNTNPGYCYTGQYPRCAGFMLTDVEAKKIIGAEKACREVVHPFVVGREFLSGSLNSRWVIDFQELNAIEAQSYSAAFRHVERKVLPYIKALAEKERRKTGKETGQDQNWLRTWWRHFRARPELIGKIRTLTRYLGCSRVTKRPVFSFFSPLIRPGDALSCFTFEDDYSFAILQSSTHWQWFITKCSKLTERFRYTPESVFDTFPWPQAPTRKIIDAVAEAGREIRRIRAAALPNTKGGLRALYRTLELPGKNPLKDAHAALDAAVLAAYGFDPKGDLLAQLLALNLEVAARIDAKKPVTAPGIPPDYPDPKKLVTKDCIEP